MRYLIAPDKFKGSLSAVQAAQAMARGVRRADPTAEVDEVPMADGGEGTVEALVSATGGSIHHLQVTGPLGEPVDSWFGTSGDGRTAFVEMAAASGLVLVPVDRRDPTRATTFGTGELIRAALDLEVDRIVVGIGGSATNDGGAGLASALGFRLLDAEGQPIAPGGGPLERLDRIDPLGRDPRLDRVEIAVACDVTNPLCGPEGASAVYGPQKGATPEMVRRLDQNLSRLADRIASDLGPDVAGLPGAGAAGGLGAGLVAFARGRLERGVELIARTVGLADRLKGVDLCLSAEGSLDEQTAHGKTVSGVSQISLRQGCPVFVLAGRIQPGAEAILDQGVSAYFSICDGPMSLDLAIEHADLLLELRHRAGRPRFLAGRSAVGAIHAH